MRIVLTRGELLEKANEALALEAWATPLMQITQVEQKGSVLVFYGTGFGDSETLIDVDTLSHLNELAQRLAEKYRLII